MTINLAILMCTYNGNKCLQAQLESFANQTFKFGNYLFTTMVQLITLKI